MLFTQFANFNALHTITAGRLNLFQHFRTKNLGTTTKIIPLDTSKLSKKGVDTLDELIDAFNVDVEEACSFFSTRKYRRKCHGNYFTEVRKELKDASLHISGKYFHNRNRNGFKSFVLMVSSETLFCKAFTCSQYSAGAWICSK